MTVLLLALTVCAIACITTQWGALSIPLIAVVLFIIGRQRRGADGISEFYAALAGVIILSLIVIGVASVAKRLLGFI